MSRNEGKHPQGYWMGIGISIGVAIGVALSPLCWAGVGQPHGCYPHHCLLPASRLT